MPIPRVLAALPILTATVVLGACGSDTAAPPAATTDQAAIEQRIDRERKDAAAEALRDRELQELRAEVKDLKAKDKKETSGKGSGAGAKTVTVQSGSSAPAPDGGDGGAAWPSTVSAWTVVLVSAETADGALSAANRARGAGLQGVGTLYSSDFPTLRAGWYVAYSGQFSSKDEAMTRAAQARSAGLGEAYQRYVSPVG